MVKNSTLYDSVIWATKQQKAQISENPFKGTSARILISGSPADDVYRMPNFSPAPPTMREFEDTMLLEKAREKLQEQQEILTRLSNDACIVHTVDKVSKDGKYTYCQKGDKEIRIEACKDLKRGHQVLLHPKTFQIIENLGFPPLEASEFAPIKIPSVEWDDIGGLEEAKRDIIEAIEMPFKEKALFNFYSKRPIKGILLSGSPGNGKTMLAKAAANSIAKLHKSESVRTGFLYIKGPEILDKYVGSSEQTIRNIFIDASRHYKEYGYPAIIFIDETDAILSARSSGVGYMNSIVNTFLTEMDGLESSNAIIMLATNRPEALDPAIVREGRIDRKIHIPRPSKTTAYKIVKTHLSKLPLADDIEELTLVMVSELYSEERAVNDYTLNDIVSGAMLAACVDLVVSSAIHRDIGKEPTGITMEDVLCAVDRIHEQNKGVSHGRENGTDIL